MNAATNRRFESLDAIRGVAVMGILAMNIVAFALPFSAYSNPAAGGPPAPADLATWVFDFVFVASKMSGLFSLLFGASTLLVIQRDRKRVVEGKRVSPRVNLVDLRTL